MAAVAQTIKQEFRIEQSGEEVKDGFEYRNKRAESISIHKQLVREFGTNHTKSARRIIKI